MRAAIAAISAMLLASTSLALACGMERWPVKTAADHDAAAINATIATTTVSALASLPAPPNPNIRQNTRFAPVETGVVAVQGYLLLVKHEADQDYHIVISDPQTDETMIVESPDPSCAPNSRFAQQIAQVRADIDNRLGGPIASRRGRLQRPLMIPVSVTGVPFFDFIHHPPQEGVARNGIELHPILGIQFGQ